MKSPKGLKIRWIHKIQGARINRNMIDGWRPQNCGRHPFVVDETFLLKYNFFTYMLRKQRKSGKQKMRKASGLLERTEYQVICGDIDTEVTGVARDNRKAEAGNLFICTKGARFDTHAPEVISALIEKGVRVFVAETPVAIPEGKEQEVCVVQVGNTREAGAFIYAAWYENPADSLTVIGITGSKGKTTTTHMLADILRMAGRSVGTIGTNGVFFGNEGHELANTTPESDEVQLYLRQMVDAGCDTAVIEVSSQGMKQHRVDGFTFDYGVWMNIQTGDHVGPNEHETFEDYMYCKAQLLNHSKLGLVHIDDEYAEEFLKLVHTETVFFGSSEKAVYRVTDIEKTFDEEEEQPGIAFRVYGLQTGRAQGEEPLSCGSWINFPGEFNAVNALAAIAVADQLGVTPEKFNEALRKVHIKGRDDMVYRGKFSVCVDFAHNGASTWHHLSALREFRPKRLICIFGADGNRSKGRRYGMGEAAGTLADLAIVTSGHNRFETFEQILSDTEVGLHKAPHPNYIAIKDRKEAIRYAIENAQEGDLITIIGLGHETWQEEMGVKRYHSDTEFVLQVISELGL